MAVECNSSPLHDIIPCCHSQIKAQRSGFDLERTSSGMTELSCLCMEAKDMKFATTRRACWTVTSSKPGCPGGQCVLKGRLDNQTIGRSRLVAYVSSALKKRFLSKIMRGRSICSGLSVSKKSKLEIVGGGVLDAPSVKLCVF